MKMSRGKITKLATVEKQYGGSSKLKVEWPQDPAVPLLGIYSEELKAGPQIDSCVPMFTAALEATCVHGGMNE